MKGPGPRNRHGGVVVFCALALVALLALTGLVVDGGNLFLIRQRLQAAVDAGALGAAQLLPATSGVTARAQMMVALNGPGGTNLVVTARPNYAGDPDKVEVVATVKYTPTMLSVLGIKNVNLGARAVGRNYIPPTTFDPFQFAGVYGENQVVLRGGGAVDSYNSSLGAYNAALGGGTFNKGNDATVVSDGAMNLSGNGYVGGSISTVMPVTMSGNARVKELVAGGNVTMSGSNTRVDGNVVTNGTFTGSSSQVGGTITPNAGVTIPQHNLPQIDTTVVATTNNNASIPAAVKVAGTPPSINVKSGDDVTLPAGTYYVSSITLGGTGKLRFSGTTKLYVTTNFSIGGTSTFINSSNNNVGLFYTGTNSLTFNAQTSATFSSGVYAPNANISLTGQGEFYGVYVAKEVDVAGGGAFHVDTGLSMPIAVTDTTNNVFALSE